MKKAFTLIELMVVMVIISILVGVSIASITKSQKNSRDSRRKADIGVIQTALESYYNQNKEYPLSVSNCGDATNWECDHKSAVPVWLSGLNNYTDKLGKDPKTVGSSYNSVSTPVIGGPLANTESSKNYYGYYSAVYNPTCISQPSCSYNNSCSAGYLAKSYYILVAVLENTNDKEMIKNSPNPRYFLNCDRMDGGSTNYNQNAYLKISAF